MSKAVSVVFIALGLGLGCNGRSDEASRNDQPPGPASTAAAGATGPAATTRAATKPSPEQPAALVVNQFPNDTGDVQAAYGRAVSRLANTTLTRSAVVAGAPAGTGTLVLYDTTGPWGWLGELYAINVGALVSHFGTWTAKPVSAYVAGELAAYAGVVYVGSTFDEPLSPAFLDDVLTTTEPVVSINDNIWQLVARQPGFGDSYGFEPWYFDTTDVASVVYKGTSLARYLPNAAGIMLHSSLTTATVLGEAVHTADNSQLPWAVQGKNLFYIGENPMSYVTATDRYLAFADILIQAFAPTAPEQHRALVRIEDVSPDTEPSDLRAIVDYLASQNVPFSVATIPHYLDPHGTYNAGVAEDVTLTQAPQLVSALKYAATKGGTIIMHGYTHQYSTIANPYSGVSADDFEFYTAHIDAANYVVYDGPTPEDSTAWAAQRIAAGLTEMKNAGLPAPTIFEFPHYAGSNADAQAVHAAFPTVYHRGYYAGGLLGGTPDTTHVIGVVYPYDGRDPFGSAVIPETMGSYEPEASNNNPPRLVPDMLATAAANLVVRDGFASFYFHPYYPLSVLQQIVTGVKASGYTFVAAGSL